MTPQSMQSRVRILDNAKWAGGKRPADPSMIILHCTEGESFLSTVEYLNTTSDKKASYNYGVEDDGRIFRMTHPDYVAWHAGDSAWPSPKVATPHNQKPNGGKSLNGISLGFAWANNGEALSLEARASMLWLIKVYARRYNIPASLIRGHYEISPGRKSDPKPACDMDAFRADVTAYLAR